MVRGKVAFAGSPLENVTVHFVVEVVVEEFRFGLAAKNFSFPKQVPP